MRRLLASAVLLVLASTLVLSGCGEGPDASGPAVTPSAPRHAILGAAGEAVVDGGTLGAQASALRRHLAAGAALAALTVDYPHGDSVFPPDLVAPTFLWHDEAQAADAWWVDVRASGAKDAALTLLVAGPPPPQGEIDPAVIGDTNEVYVPTPYQASARSWTPSEDAWAAIKRHGRGAGVVLSYVGVASSDPAIPLSRGTVSIRTSEDPVGAPIFYRDVPLIPSVGESGRIQPLARKLLPLIAWRLRDVSQPESRLLLTGMPSCANCHSFSRDGKTFGMDVDGPDGDKGMYAILPVAQKMTIGRDQTITWNSFRDKPQDHKTIGFLSRVSPDGKYVLSTLNEALYVANFTNYRFLQVFFPTRGLLAWYSRETEEIRALPGADDPHYVQTDGVWTPDGETVVFARAVARDPDEPGKPKAKYPNDPLEPEIRYDLYRIPFRDGQGGTAVAIEGASDNGMSNTFPKVSPDGKWVVYTKCRNGQLMRPDGRLWIVPLEGGEAREMACNTNLMNSWHSFSPNGRWMVFSSKVNTPYTQMFLTHIDDEGRDSPPILIPNSTAANRAVNIPEFLNADYDAIQEIEVPAARHHVHFQRGLTLLREGRSEQAVEHLQEALAADPEFSRAHASLGRVFQKLGRTSEARAHYEQALAIDGRNPQVLTSLGVVLMEDGEIEGAMALWRRAVDVNPHDAMAHHNLGLALGRKKLLREAALHFERAVEANPELVVARKNLGMIALELGRTDQALVHFLSALERDPKDGAVRGYVVDILVRQGKIQAALPHMEALVEQRPRDPLARMILAWHLATRPEARIRDGARAVELARRAVEMTGRSEPVALDALAAAYAETGDFRRAVETAEEAAKLAAAKDPDRAREIRERVRLYRLGRPYRQR